MKLKKSFCTQKVADGQIMVPVDNSESNFKGIVRSNSTAAFVVDMLKEGTTKEELLQKLADTYDAPVEKLVADLDKVLEKLRSIDAIEE